MDDLQNQIEQYSDLIYRYDALTIKKKDLIDETLTPEIKAKLLEIDAEFDPILLNLSERKRELEACIKEQVLSRGESVRGKSHAFCWYKPRSTWDTRALEGYGVAHPEIMQFRKLGKPTVYVRKAWW